jgi:uncharacterized protein
LEYFFDRIRPASYPLAVTTAPKTVVAMVHVRALPGSPRHCLPIPEIAALAVDEARRLQQAGFDRLLLENMHDLPYLRGSVGPEIVAAMTAVGVAVRAAVQVPIGIQILAGANDAAMAAALACGAQFVRVENFVFAHVADEGLMPAAAAGPLLRYRRSLGAEQIQIWADIKKKHASHAISADISISQAAEAAAFSGADAVIVTGVATGKPADFADLVAARVGEIPLLVGSGLSADNLHRYWALADGFIVGSSLKRGGRWDAPLCDERLDQWKQTLRDLRSRDAHAA